MGSWIFSLFNASSTATLWAAGGKNQKLVHHSVRTPIPVVNAGWVSAVSPETGVLRCSCHKGAAGVLEGLCMG